jgi:hypothetical protein
MPTTKEIQSALTSASILNENLDKAEMNPNNPRINLARLEHISKKTTAETAAALTKTPLPPSTPRVGVQTPKTAFVRLVSGKGGRKIKKTKARKTKARKTRRRRH